MTVTPSSESWRNPDIIDAALQPLYPELPYHNWRHGSETAAASAALASVYAACKGNEPCNKLRIEWGGKGHDAGIGAYKSDRWLQKRFGSAEKYSADLTLTHMAATGAPLELAEQVQEDIWSTQVGIACTSLYALFLRRADLKNVYSRNRFEIIRCSFLVLREEKLLHGEAPGGKLDFDEAVHFAEKSHSFLQPYIDEDVHLGSFDVDAEGRTANERAAANHRQLLPASFSRIIRENPEFAQQLQPETG